MQVHALERGAIHHTHQRLVLIKVTVLVITRDRVTLIRKVNPNLVGAACLNRDL